jgi:hypothetical protein
MLYLKTNEEVGLLRKSNLLVSKTLAEIAKIITSIKLQKHLSAIMADYRLLKVITVSRKPSVHLSTTKLFMESLQDISLKRETLFQ